MGCEGYYFAKRLHVDLASDVSVVAAGDKVVGLSGLIIIKAPPIEWNTLYSIRAFVRYMQLVHVTL